MIRRLNRRKASGNRRPTVIGAEAAACCLGMYQHALVGFLLFSSHAKASAFQKLKEGTLVVDGLRAVDELGTWL